MASSAATILLIGGSGQVGSELRPLLAKLGACVAPSSSELDLTRPDITRHTVKQLRPAVIVNAAGYTAVDRAESEPEQAFSINAAAPAVLAEEAEKLGSLFVHYSTDYVFDGEKRTPYNESDPVSPLGVYGDTKAKGEQAVVSHAGPHMVIRTSWVYGPNGTNFPRTILRLARERSELRVVNDQIGAPTSAIFLATVTADLISRWLSEGGGKARRWSGIYHLTAAGSTTWFDFAQSVLMGDPRKSEQMVERIMPVPTAEYKTAARRPRYSVLDCTKIERQFGIERSEWRTQLSEVMKRWEG